MNAVLFAPHNDDETLFAFYQVLRHKPRVIIVLRSFKEAAQGGPLFAIREWETHGAMEIAGVEWEQWEFSDLTPHWGPIRDRVAKVAKWADFIIGPAYEDGGHEHHNEIASILDPHQPEISYLTYVRGRGRSEGVEIVPTAEERDLKSWALNCYASQAQYPPTAPWFGPDQREFVLGL